MQGPQTGSLIISCIASSSVNIHTQHRVHRSPPVCSKWESRVSSPTFGSQPHIQVGPRLGPPYLSVSLHSPLLVRTHCIHNEWISSSWVASKISICCGGEKSKDSCIMHQGRCESCRDLTYFHARYTTVCVLNTRANRMGTSTRAQLVVWKRLMFEADTVIFYCGELLPVQNIPAAQARLLETPSRASLHSPPFSFTG